MKDVCDLCGKAQVHPVVTPEGKTIFCPVCGWNLCFLCFYNSHGQECCMPTVMRKDSQPSQVEIQQWLVDRIHT